MRKRARRAPRGRKYLLGVAFATMLLVAATTISPALGGPSLRKLVKREVAKQLAGKSGPQGAQGIQGVPGSAVAYADVTEDGQLVAGRSKNIVSVVKPESSLGIYCFDVAVPVVNAVASAHYSGSSSEAYPRVDVPANSFCTSSGKTDASVVMAVSTSTNGDDEPFFIAFN